MSDDIGTRVVQFIREQLQVDDEWCEDGERAFRWWAGPLAQSVWAEPCVEDDGLTLSRVHVRTQVVTGVPDDDRMAELGPFMAAATLGGFVRARDHTLELASSAFAHAEVADATARALMLAAVLQVTEAHQSAPILADRLAAKVAASAPAGRDVRRELDSILSVVERVIQPAGIGASVYAGWEMNASADMLDRAGFVSFAGEDGLTAEFPLPATGTTSLLKLSTTDPHPAIGNGLRSRLSLPMVGFSPDPDDPTPVRVALSMNEREVLDTTWVTFLGSWHPTQFGVAHTSFLPNVLGGGPGWVQTAVTAMAGRAGWVSDMFSSDDEG